MLFFKGESRLQLRWGRTKILPKNIAIIDFKVYSGINESKNESL